MSNKPGTLRKRRSPSFRSRMPVGRRRVLGIDNIVQWTGLAKLSMAVVDRLAQATDELATVAHHLARIAGESDPSYDALLLKVRGLGALCSQSRSDLRIH
jgi:hypothetical protein